ncbi:MAG: hypothetical protein ACMUHM_03745 [Thermoplasmatota archaeon]
MKKLTWTTIILVLGSAVIAGCLGDDDDDGEKTRITINGKEYVVDDIFDDFSTITIMSSNDQEYEGVPLKDLLEDAGVSDPSAYTYRITASDAYSKEVTHLDIEEGILVKEEVMTAFPDLPGKYRIRDVVSIEPIEGDTITVNGMLYTWMQPFDLFTERIMYDNESNEYAGVLLSDLINATELADPQDHNFTIMANDYQKEVTWDDMLNGILVNDDDHMTFFPDLEKKYRVKNVVEITVV